MTIIIKEIYVRTTVERSLKPKDSLTPETVVKLKREIVKEVLKTQQLQDRWDKER